jgi:hypothetical protein
MINKIELRFTRHGLERLFQRKISPKECERVYESGVIIEQYPDDKPFPSKLYLGVIDQRALHIVVATEEQIAHVITAYEPDSNLWESDFKTRRIK